MKNTLARLEKIEKYLQDRWNWLNLPRPKTNSQSPAKSSLSRNKTKLYSPCRQRTIIVKQTKGIDMLPDVQEKGEVNQLCLQRDRNKKKLMAQAGNPFTVGAFERMKKMARTNSISY